jgi:hypothetical protein
MTLRTWLGHWREQRCFLLFLALLGLLISMPFVVDTVHGRVLVGLLNVIVLVTAVAAVERSRIPLVVAFALGIPTLGSQMLALHSGLPVHFAVFWGFAAAFYAFTILNLLNYVLRRDEMTGDKLYGAVAVYIMIAMFWALVFGVLQHIYPGAYAFHGTVRLLDMGELIFYSFTVLTTAGFGDITPASIHSRFPTILEALTGVMYVAILIARLTGVYPVAGKTP